MNLAKFDLCGRTVFLVRTRTGKTFFGDCPRKAIAAALAYVTER